MISDPVKRAVQDLSKLLKSFFVMSSDSILAGLKPTEFSGLERERWKQSCLYHQMIGKCSLKKWPQFTNTKKYQCVEGSL